MPVFKMSCFAPNGTSRHRDVIADSADDALADWRQQIEIEEDGQVKGFTFEVAARPDPDGRYEQLLKDGERRRLEDAFYAMPKMRKGRR